MSAPAVTSVSVTQLSTMCELGVGGQGTVVLVQAPGPSAEPMAFKEYSAASRDQVDMEALERLVALPWQSDEELRSLLFRHTAWPVATVHRDGTVCGFLMPAAPDDFQSYLRFPTGYQPQLLAMEFLLNPPDYMANVDLPVTERVRLALLRELAVVLRGLHRHGVVVGDLSPKNVLVSLRAPRCYLLDCDAVRLGGRSVLPQIETPDWRLPDGEELATEASDRFKFGLLTVRLLESDQSASDPGLLRQAQPALADLAERSRADPASRPAWDEWVNALDVAIPLASISVPTSPGPAAQPTSPVPGLPAPSPASPKRRWWGALAMLLVAGVLAVLGGLLSGGFGGDENGAPDAAPAPAPARDTQPTSVGMVDVTGAAGDPDTLPVAELFDAYFRGINRQDWDAVLALYDPAGVVDNTDPEQRGSFIDGMETTVDSDVRLLEVRPDGRRMLARVAFRSEQAEGYGPKDDPDQTCTRWDVTFILAPHGDGYRILRSDGASSAPC